MIPKYLGQKCFISSYANLIDISEGISQLLGHIIISSANCTNHPDHSRGQCNKKMYLNHLLFVDP